MWKLNFLTKGEIFFHCLPLLGGFFILENIFMTSKDLLPAPKTVPEAWDMAEMLSQSQLIPKPFQGRPADVVVAMMWAHSLQIPVVQGLNHIAVINGKPSLFGDGLLAVVMSSGQCSGFKETYVGEGDQLTATCTVTRKGLEAPFVGSFSVADAKLAGLWGKAGPWKMYPKRMLKMRARAFALRDAFPDVLSGMASAEELQDIDVEAVEKEETEAPARKMPRRKKAVAAEDVAAIEQAAPTSEQHPEVAPKTVEPQPAEQPQPETPAAEPQQVADPQPQPKANVSQEDALISDINCCSSIESLMRIWNSLPPEVRTNQRIFGTFSQRKTQILKEAGESK